jgi:uncharacterized protein with NRDE domain
MCTLSIIPCLQGHILTMNRDEALTRAEGEPRLVRGTEGDLRYWHTVDAATGGSWFGVRGDGLVAALLNRYQDTMPSEAAGAPLRSRGSLITTLLHSTNGMRLAQLAATLQSELFAPFDLYVYQGGELQGLHWDGLALQLRAHALSSPRLFTSSSAHAESARALREQQFAAYLRAHPTPDAAHVLTHLHAADHPQPALAMRMRRPGRATRSIAQAEVNVDGLRFLHKPLT